MKRSLKVLMLGTALVLAGGILAPVTAQDDKTGQGGIIVEGTFGSGPGTLNPLDCLDTTCGRVLGLMFPGLVGVDPEKADFVKAGQGALALDWTVSDDGLTYTFTLRDDMKWTDGTAITAKDVVYGWNHLSNAATESPYNYLTSSIESIEAPDDTTLVVKFKAADCTALATAASVPIVPSHVFPEDVTAAKDSEFATNPSVSGGPFQFVEFRTGELTSLAANPNYPAKDTQLGYVSPEGWIYTVVPDQTVQVEQFLAGEHTFIDTPPVGRRADLRAAEAEGKVKTFNFPGNSWDYLALNFADPANPQPAFDESGKAIDQGHHPLFGDPRVRKAIAMAVDVDAIIKGAVFGEGTRMVSNMLPTAWAFNENIKAVELDPEGAKALLEEAGWVDSDGDGVREATEDAMYAEPGTKLAFTLYTNSGNTRREAIGTIVKDVLEDIGFAVDFQAIDFNVVLEKMDAQNFDAVILGWRNGFPDDPDQTQIFTTEADTLGGSNFISYHNEEVDKLMKEALYLPGCDPEKRAELYGRIQEIMAEEMPYVWLFVQNGMYAAQAGVENFSPFPSQPIWNIDAWTMVKE